MIKRLKYQARLDTVRSLSRSLIERIGLECSEPPECLVPTPLHSSRQRSRGFNQAREIARVSRTIYPCLLMIIWCAGQGHGAPV